MPKINNLIGQTFNSLTVKERAKNKNGCVYWICLCVCGKQKTVRASNLVSGQVKSCGCLHQKNTPRKHSKRKTAEYSIWANMKSRCYNKNDKEYGNYGDRGIQVCRRWQLSFDNFFKDVGKRPTKKHSLGRIDNNGNYTPENVKWETNTEQSRNRRTNHMITWNGKTQCLTDWADHFGISRKTMFTRVVQRGWSIEKAFTTPVLDN